MSERDDLDLLDRRLLGYLRERSELQAALGPGVEAMAAAVAGGAAVPRQARGPARLGVLAWALLAMALLVAALAVAAGAGGRRDASLAVVPSPTSQPPSSAGPSAPAPTFDTAVISSPIAGGWLLDFPASGIDNSYGGSPRPDGLEFGTGVSFIPGGSFEVSSGAGGGCLVRGTWSSAGGAVTIDVTTGQDPCEASGPGPAAREIRRRLAAATQFTQAGERMSLLDDAGHPLLEFQRISLLSGLGRLQLDFDRSGIPGWYTVDLQKRQRIDVASSLAFADGSLEGGTGGGGGCDSFTGTYREDGSALSITVPVAEGHCGPESPDLEVRRRLSRAAMFNISGATLRLFDAQGAQLLVYHQAP